MQEAFLRAWRASATYDPARASQRTWLFAILRNVVIDLARARRARPPLRRRHAARRSGAADDELDRALTAWQVESALAELDDDHRRVLVEVHWRGRPYHEVADDLGIPAGHREEPRVLRAARHAHAPRSAGVARWLSAPSPARRGSRRWPAGWWLSSRRRRRRTLVAHLDGCATCRAEADSLLHVAAAHPRRRRRRRAAAEPPPRRPRRSDRRAGRSRATGAPSPAGWPWR